MTRPIRPIRPIRLNDNGAPCSNSVGHGLQIAVTPTREQPILSFQAEVPRGRDRVVMAPADFAARLKSSLPGQPT